MIYKLKRTKILLKHYYNENLMFYWLIISRSLVFCSCVLQRGKSKEEREIEAQRDRGG